MKKKIQLFLGVLFLCTIIFNITQQRKNEISKLNLNSIFQIAQANAEDFGDYSPHYFPCGDHITCRYDWANNNCTTMGAESVCYCYCE